MNHEQIAELEATADECPTPQAKMPRPPNVSTKVQVNCREKAENLSRWQLHRRKKKIVSVLKPVHCASGGSSSSNEKAVQDRLWTSVRNSSDIVKQSDNGLLRNLKTEIMQGCEIPKIIPYKTLMTHIRNIDIGELLGLESLAEKFSTEAVPGVYRPLKPLLLKLADLYLSLHGKKPCLHWFNGEESVVLCGGG